MTGAPVADDGSRHPTEAPKPIDPDDLEPRPLPIAVLISGQGTNLNAILHAKKVGALNVDVRLVISNRSEAPGLRYSRDTGIPTSVLARGDFPSRDAQQRAMLDELSRHGVELIVLAGFNQILSDELVQRYSGRILNVHPSLLPAFGGGMHAVRDALDYGAKVTGVTVHFIWAELPDVDSGPIALQEAVLVLDDDSEETLLERIHTVEHRLLPAAIQLIAEGRLVITGRRTKILARPGADIIFRSTMG